MKTVPSFKTFTLEQLEKNIIMSDIDLMDSFARKYYTNTFWQVYNFWMLGKKLESYRKRLWALKTEWVVIEDRRIKTPIDWMKGEVYSSEIFYTLPVNNDSKV
jgi:hypothetical protein